MEKVILKASKRTIVGRKVKKIRAGGQIPANIYGKKVASKAISVDLKEFGSVYAKAGETSLVELTIDHEKHPVLIHQVAYHPVSHVPIHIDFHQVDLKEKVTAKVPLVLLGDAKAVKDKTGVLLTLLNEVEVEALPADLPERIEVAVGHLVQIGDCVKVGDIKVSDKIHILTSSDHEIVKVAPLVSKEAEKMAAEEAAAAAAAAAAAIPATEAAATGETASEPSTAKPSPESSNPPAQK